ncbi:MAG: hypothetical protein F4Y78_03285 [Candidatus Dadabacteria bacterium]|nr:hypothetical protein [Candidatus Dadabacteria bacterium]MYA49115.1 hypothetical protein [Candidatus Dadabacteria bacterium]MYG82679.1 hypothetical protein [Candidatus Dadabacteria bacterium]MYK48947.1 hypothetical protein [Candidatus Dadabacteria bacterium]
MTTRKKTTDEIEWVEKTFEEIKDVVRLLMNAAQTHKRASVLCMGKARASRLTSPERFNVNVIDYFLLSAVSFELIFVSVEQSLRLLFLLLFRLFPKKPNHDLLNLYEELQYRSADEEGICRDIIQEINVFGQTKNIRPISEDELIACLKRHGSSYMDFKYFHVDIKGKSNRNKSSVLSDRDLDIFFCFAAALICLNIEEMEKRGFGFPFIWPVPESEMTERLKALKKRADSAYDISAIVHGK